ncbi:hypothetical protein AT959_12270 [Dechloromonas denitrificans]|uniref:Glycosyltransferase 2-like domain-containing protein n=1 Tax=Dechloromonas denitrificans TaxID=281362 RepID=A0A133XGS4_9RHOO|nr:glycosyltransferase family 2 protein [Dechloromonas denitrificans]KXB30143.1 hypothetical protein AT959_12270 [Dechloromonas denitrificans]
MLGTERAIWAVVVTYNPNMEGLGNLISALAPQVAGVIVVDNASSPDITSQLARFVAENATLLRMPENLGIAEAQNVGIEYAICSGAAFIYLSDQDSVPGSTMLSELLSVLTGRRMNPVAAVGPATVDSRTGVSSFFVVERSGLPRRWMQPVEGQVIPKDIEVSFLIASGTLIPVEVLKRLGGMRSQYFIDHVDTEWCFRARAAGYVLLGVPEARLVHQLGDSVKAVWFFGKRQVMYHSPLRDYYMFRNTLLLLRDVSMSWIWRAHFLWRLVQFAGYFLTFSDDRSLRLRRMVLGVLHGLQGRAGRLDAATGCSHELPESPIGQV